MMLTAISSGVSACSSRPMGECTRPMLINRDSAGLQLLHRGGPAPL